MDGITERIRPYEGTSPYIFVSYSHCDLDRIRPILQGLADREYRFWYDEGIDPGTEWPESIANHLERSAVCIAIMSPSSAISRNCRREINFALSKNIELVTLYIEPTELSPGLEMQLSTHPSIMGYTYPEPSSLLDRIESMDGVVACRGAWNETTAAGKARKPVKAVPKKRNVALILIALLLVLAVPVGIWIGRGSRQKEAAPDAFVTGTRTTWEAIIGPTPEAAAGTIAEGTAELDPDATPIPALSPEPIPEQYVILATGEWEDCAVAVCEKDEKTVYIQLTDSRIPYAYTVSEHPGNELLDWEVLLAFQVPDSLRFSIRTDPYAPSLTMLHTTLTFETRDVTSTLGGFRYTLKGTTLCFESALPGEYTTKDISDISVLRRLGNDSYYGYFIFND